MNVYKLKPKLERTQFVNFFDYKKFNKFLKKQKINLPSFDIHHIKYMFEHGALAFCAVIDHDLAHITWVAMDETAKKKLEPWSMEVDWDIEACWGLAQTSPTYLRLGLYSCVHAQVAMYLKSKGIKKNKFTINKSNIPSNQAMSKFHPEVFANGYYLKFFFWVFRIKVNKT